MTEDITEAKPLELDWCCGVNTKIDVIDLTTPDTDTTVAFAANHIVVIQVNSELRTPHFKYK